MIRTNPFNLQRIAYYEGQLLASSDLQDDTGHESQLRGLHVRAMHNTWGVALGYEVGVDDSRTAVTVGPGIAYDCRGREVLSARTLALGLPTPPQGDDEGPWIYDLVIHYKSLEDLMGQQELLMTCLAPIADPGQEQVEWCGSSEEDDGRETEPEAPSQNFRPKEERPGWLWHLAQNEYELSPEVRLGEEIPLARFRVKKADQSPGGYVLSKPDFSFRRSAQGLVRPHIASGRAKATVNPNESQLAFTVNVDTSEGGFNQTPFYFASLIENPLFTLAEEILEESPERILRLVLGPFINIRDAGRTSFKLDIRYAVPRGIHSTAGMALLDVDAGLPVKANWLGIEPVGGCPPEPIYAFLVHLLWQPIFFARPVPIGGSVLG